MKTNHEIKLGVSLYSYQDNYYFHKHDLEGCLAAAAGAGAEGIEVFSDAMIPEWPYISDEFIDKWNGWMYRYDLEPVCLDHFSDRAMWHDRQLTDDEMYERGALYIRTAARLGCKAVRVLHNEHVGSGISPYRLTDCSIVERLLPIAAEHDVMLALECHNPTNVADPIQQQYLEMADRVGLPYVGLQADFSSYEYCVSMADIGNEVRNAGAHEEVLLCLREKQRQCYREKRGFKLEEFMGEFEKLHPTQEDLAALVRLGSFQGPYGDDRNFSYETLKEYASKLVYIHGKFYDIDEDGEVDSMDYHEILKALQDGGYKGYISSEFEGNRRMNDAGWCDEIEYVRKHHVLMRKCLGYEEAEG